MVATELLILGVLDILCLTSIVVFAFWMRKELEEALIELDNSLALAIKNTLESVTGGEMGGFEAPNPIQVAIGQMIAAMASQKMNTVDALVTHRDDSGRFKKKIDEMKG